MLFDMPLEQLEVYRPAREEALDFDAFWHASMAKVSKFPLNTIFDSVDFGLGNLETYDVTFSGYGGQRIKGWLLLPRRRKGPVPCVIEYVGYGGGRGFPVDWLLWSSVGYAHLIMDVRGQGGIWLRGDTPDPEPDGSSPNHPGYLTRGIFDRETYYYRRVYIDAVRAVDAALCHSDVDETRIAVAGHSQGGGIAIAVSGLSKVITAMLTDAPFLCHMRRASEITDLPPYSDLAAFCRVHRDDVNSVFETLSYFDAMNFATRADANALFSTGLMDLTCPPSTVLPFLLIERVKIYLLPKFC